MGKTIIEKIIQAHAGPVGAGSPAKPGDIVWIGLDARTARDFGGANVVKNYRQHYGDAPVDDATKTFFTFDLVTPANNIPYAINQQICRDWAKEQGVRVFDVDMGIGSHVAIEQGLTWPGATFVGTDSHLNILGAIGAFGQGMGDQDIAFTYKAGKTWFEVPHTMKVTITGELKPPCTAKDLTLACLRRLGASGALGQAVDVRRAYVRMPTQATYPVVQVIRADKQHIGRVDLHVFLLWMFPTTLWRDIRNGTFENFQKSLLNPFAGHIPGN